MPSIDYRRLRERIRIAEVLSWMPWTPSERRGDQLRGDCPLCGSSAGERASSRCFCVKLSHQLFCCFRCHRSGNALDLWAYYRSQSIHAAATEIQQRLAAPATPESSNRQKVMDRPEL
jgi:DNA primase